MSLSTLQRLSSQPGAVTAATVYVDSIDNLATTTTEVQNSLGSSVADVTSSVTQANNAIQPLESIKNISLYSLAGAVIAGSVIILLTMVMIVRERRREIGVIKAIGSSNTRVIFQFMTEAVTLTLMGAVIGLVLGVIGSSPVTKLLVTNSTATGAGGGRGGGFIARSLGGNGAFGVRNVHAVVSWNILLYGLIAAIVIAVVGSAVASALIAKVRPAEVMRTE
jgi:putative ABC transport system permease protein